MIILRGKNETISFTGEQIFVAYTRTFLSDLAKNTDKAIELWNKEGYSVIDDGREMNDIGEETY